MLCLSFVFASRILFSVLKSASVVKAPPPEHNMAITNANNLYRPKNKKQQREKA